MFAFAFALALVPVLKENARISDGRLSFLSVNGGLNFFFNFSKTYELRTHVKGYHFHIVPPATVNHPENGRVHTRVPFHEQGWYYSQGWKHLRNRPAVLLDNLRGMSTVFFGPLLPSFSDAAGFKPMMAAFNVLDFGLFLAIPLVLWAALFRRGLVAGMRAEILFLAGLVAISFATMYVFGAEQRYLYSFLFAIVLLAVLAGRVLLRGWPHMRRPLAVYVTGLAILCGGDWAVGAVRAGLRERPIAVTVTQNRKPIASLLDVPEVASRRTLQVDQLRFPFGPTLRHETLGELGFSRDYFIEAQADFRFLTKGQSVTFEVFSDDGFSLRMDADRLSMFPRDRMFPTSPNRATVASDGGQHTLRISYFQGQGPQGLLVFYSVRDANGRTQRYALGESSSTVRFLPPATRTLPRSAPPALSLR